jgi:molecular chaperone GrpE
MSDAHKNKLLEEFQNYLETVDLTQFASEQPADLNTLLSELTSLKSEVKAESRQFKNTLETLTTALGILQTDNNALVAELALHGTQLQQQRYELSRTILMDVVDIYDRLLVGLTVLQNYKPTTSFFANKQDPRFISSVTEGQAITLKRLENVLQRYQIFPIDCLGKTLDPHTMNAVEIGHNAKLPNGVVLEELRKGFLFENNVLRLAEVKVNKL